MRACFSRAACASRDIASCKAAGMITSRISTDCTVTPHGFERSSISCCNSSSMRSRPRNRSVSDFLDDAAQCENLRLDGVMTHLASADDSGQRLFTEQQTTRFESALEVIHSRGHKPKWIHAAASAGALAYPSARGNLVRPGGILYGLWRDVINPATTPLDWRPVMSLRTRVILVKTVPANTPLGYGGTFITARESRI